MALLVLPLLVFAYYKQKDRLRFWLWFFIYIGSVLGVLGSGELAHIVLFINVIAILIVWLSARFTAWCIKRYVNRKKTN
ncbi:MAG: hypothetical protein OXL96_07990 [Candidatus Poribacteria bacterium]|nr:hypothetical protein [Candidatus Poribacteria bacterium]